VINRTQLEWALKNIRSVLAEIERGLKKPHELNRSQGRLTATHVRFGHCGLPDSPFELQRPAFRGAQIS